MTTTPVLIEQSEPTATETVTPAPEIGDADTTEKLAALGDDIRLAQEQRWKREQQEKRQHRNRVFAENRLSQIVQEIPTLEAAIAERQPAVDELESRFDEQQAAMQKLVNDRGYVDARNAAEYNALSADLEEIRRALVQALNSGAELVEGASAMQGGGGLVMSLSPMSVRIVHPLLEEIAADVDWAHPLAPMVERLEKLTAERAKLKSRRDK